MLDAGALRATRWIEAGNGRSDSARRLSTLWSASVERSPPVHALDELSSDHRFVAARATGHELRPISRVAERAARGQYRRWAVKTPASELPQRPERFTSVQYLTPGRDHHPTARETPL